MRMFGKSSCRHSSCERGLLLSIFDFKRKKYRTFLQDSETGEEILRSMRKAGESGKSMMFRMGRVRR